MFITREKIEKSVKFQISICFILAFVINFTIETCGRGGIKEAVLYLFEQPIIFFYNYLLILLSLSFVLLIRRRMFGWCVISVLWLALGITNGIILGLRVTPFTAIDLMEANAGLSIMGKYFNNFQMTLLFICIFLACILFVAAFIFAPKYKEKMHYGRNVAVIGLCVVAFFFITKFSLNEGILARHFGNLNYAYKDYGVPYCFTVTLLDTGIKEPEDYTEERVTEALNASEEENSPIAIKEGTVQKKPNVIFIQLESFFDPTQVKGLTFSEDPIPTYHKLMEDYSSGYLKVPVVGAGTCNTEFEAITGMNLDFFGPGEYPYKTVLQKKTSESTAYNLADIGYSTHAIHDNTATFYDRNKVFANLGFDTFTSIEYMVGVEKNPNGWAKDQILVSQILDAMNSSTEPDYIYTVSVQGHGSYPSTKIDETQTITVSGIEDEGKKNQYEYYANQIHEMDQFVANLTNELSKQDEDVILVLYGDHLPGLGVKEDEIPNGSLYQTEYVVWDNFGLEQKDMNLETYQLSAAVLGRVGINNGTLINFHQKNMGSDNYYKNQQELMYDMLFGKKYIYGQENPFETIDMKMGVKDITISSIYSEDDLAIVKGENFTQYSKIYINGDYIETTFIDSNTLQIDKDKLKSEDIVTVCQSRKDKTILSASEEFIYNGN